MKLYATVEGCWTDIAAKIITTFNKWREFNYMIETLVEKDGPNNVFLIWKLWRFFLYITIKSFLLVHLQCTDKF